MGTFFDRFKRKKEEVTKVEEKPKVEEETNLLKKLCGDDKALYEDLSYSLYLEPRSKGTYAEAIKKAKKADAKDALFAYTNAGALALYEGNVDGVKEAFEKYAELSDRKYERIRKVPEKAVEIARKYYKEELKPIKEKK